MSTNTVMGRLICNFALCDTEILCEMKFGNFRTYENAILVILQVRNCDFLEEITHLRVQRIPKFSLCDPQVLREIKVQFKEVKYCNFGYFGGP